MIHVNITGNGDFDQVLRELGKRAPAVSARAQNRAIQSARTQLTRDVRDDLQGLKAGTVRDRISIFSANKSHPIARLQARTQRVPLVEFGAKGPFPSRGRGAVRLKGRTYAHAFMMPRRSGGLGVFERPSGPRLPVIELKGPSIYQSAVHHLGPAADRAKEVFAARLEHEMQRELASLAKK